MWMCILVTRPKNRKSAAKFFPRLQKLFTLLICYTHNRGLTRKALGTCHHQALLLSQVSAWDEW